MTVHTSKQLFLTLLVIETLTAVFAISCNFDEHECIFVGKCIDSEYVCDGDNDCGDWSDESAESCGLVGPESAATVSTKTCGFHEFGCTHKCIPLLWVCDGEHDCDDASDEDSQNCDLRNLIVPPTVTVPDKPDTSPSTTEEHEYVSFHVVDYDTTYPDFLEDTTNHEIETFYISPAPKVPLRLPTVHPSTTLTVMTDDADKKVHPSTTLKVMAGDADTTEDILDNCDLQGDSSLASIFSMAYWMEISLIALSLAMAIIIIIFFYRRHRKRMHMTITHPRRNPQPAVVSYLNTPANPECQLVLVGSSLSVQPAVLQTTTSGQQYPDMPPPYNTQAAGRASKPSFEEAFATGGNIV